ncbi:hypothetical protein [Falsiroseomonas stagni]|nr:hypothetical protein [Falsiroseomonas stagni]
MPRAIERIGRGFVLVADDPQDAVFCGAVVLGLDDAASRPHACFRKAD